MLLTETKLRKIIRRSLQEFKLGSITGGTGIKNKYKNKSKTQTSTNGLGGVEFEYSSNNAAVSRAKEELKQMAGRKEDESKEARAMIDKYWQYLGRNPTTMKDQPWSAAFISYVMQDEGMKSSMHADWKEKAVRNTEAIKINPGDFKGKELFVAFDFSDVKDEIVPGDNLWKRRTGPNTGPRSSHSDIVINDKEAIGGNLSNTIEKVTDIFNNNYELVIRKVKILEKVSNS